MIAKLKKIEYWLAGVAIATVIVGAIYAHGQLPSMLGGFGPTANIHDESFIHAVNNISNLVPKNETLVVSAGSAVIKYFGGHPVKIPFNVNSEKSLVQYMAKNNFTYFLVVKGKTTGSSAAQLKPLTSTKGLLTLNPDFQRIANIKTEFATLYLYKIRG